MCANICFNIQVADYSAGNPIIKIGHRAKTIKIFLSKY